MAVSNKIFIPTFISSINYEPVRTLPHIYFYNGLKECETYFIQHYPSGSDSSVSIDSQSAFPYYDYYDGVIPNGQSNSLLFFNELPAYGETPSGSLYTEYWDTYVSLLYNPRTRLFKASAIIPLADYFEMELNDIVQWRGNYYHLRAINDYNLKDGTCNIELLGPIIRDAVDRGPEPIPPGPPETCVFEFSSSFEGFDTVKNISLEITGSNSAIIESASIWFSNGLNAATYDPDNNRMNNCFITVTKPSGFISGGNYLYSASVDFGSITSSYNPNVNSGVFFIMAASGSSTYTMNFESITLDNVFYNFMGNATNVNKQSSNFGSGIPFLNDYDNWKNLKVSLSIT